MRWTGCEGIFTSFLPEPDIKEKKKKKILADFENFFVQKGDDYDYVTSKDEGEHFCDDTVFYVICIFA
jgi:hypothetical protein